jgi:hypothetical protein
MNEDKKERGTYTMREIKAMTEEKAYPKVAIIVLNWNGLGGNRHKGRKKSDG